MYEEHILSGFEIIALNTSKYGKNWVDQAYTKDAFCWKCRHAGLYAF